MSVFVKEWESHGRTTFWLYLQWYSEFFLFNNATLLICMIHITGLIWHIQDFAPLNPISFISSHVNPMLQIQKFARNQTSSHELGREKNEKKKKNKKSSQKKKLFWKKKLQLYTNSSSSSSSLLSKLSPHNNIFKQWLSHIIVMIKRNVLV